MTEDFDVNLEKTTVDMGLSGFNNHDSFPIIDNTSQHPNNRRKQIILFACIGGTVLLIILGLILGLLLFSGRSEKGDQYILDNVFAAGVNLGGMTVDEAIGALHVATDHGISQQPMEVTIYDKKLSLTPEDVDLVLDVEALAQAAYNYGRSGTHAENQQIQKNASNRSHTLPLLPYLNLNLQAIRQKVDAHCTSEASEYSEPNEKLSDDKKSIEITLGTPSRQLNADDLYNQILDAYSMNNLSFVFETPEVVWPPMVSAQELFDKYCTPPQDAMLDPGTYSIIPEKEGYGFQVEVLQQKLDAAQQELINTNTVTTIIENMTVLEPAIRSEDLNNQMFSQTLAEVTITSTEKDEARNNNIKLSCDAINGYIVKPGETFSFLEALGAISAESGYTEAKVCSVNDLVMGGGISQTASALYHCILHADLATVEHHNHEYAPDFIELGLDAYVYADAKDLRFRNNTDSPICIEAAFARNVVSVSLIGSTRLTYSISIRPEITETFTPNRTTQMFLPDNSQGYVDGQVIVQGIEGYKVSVYQEKYDLSTGALLSTESISINEYNKRDEIVASIGTFADKDPEQTEQPEQTDQPEQTEQSASSSETP